MNANQPASPIPARSPPICACARRSRSSAPSSTGRITAAGERRRDRLVVPEVELLWWPGKWRIEAEAKYIFTGSNEPVREREGYRLTLSLGYAF